jgi:hypothetical protein
VKIFTMPSAVRETSEACAVQSVPEIGQLAIVRKRPFVITEIIPSAPGFSGENHLVDVGLER